MEEYEVHCSPEVGGPRVVTFNNFSDAMREAERLSRDYTVTSKVVRVLGRWISDTRWVSNGVPGNE
jgi:hypothetical protein